jgi:hypothetical protein
MRPYAFMHIVFDCHLLILPAQSFLPKLNMSALLMTKAAAAGIDGSAPAPVAFWFFHY